MNDARDPNLVPDWQLERFRLQELPPPEMETLATAIAADDTLRRRLEQLASDDRAVLEQLPPRTMALAVRARYQQTAARPGRRLALWQTALAATAMLVVVGVTLFGPGRGPTTSSLPGTEPTRIKGLRPEVLLFRKTANGAEPLTRASVAHPGDVIQLAYQAAGRRYGVIVSVDSRGLVTPHLPRSGSRAAELVAGSNVPLPTAYELDDAPRWEAFYVVAATQPFDVAVVVAAARAAAPTNGAGGNPARLALPAGFAQSAFLLKKDMPR
jgi:hypothetical protein